MRRVLLVWTVVMLASAAQAADPKPYLRVETGVHGSVINRAILLPNGTAIATVSDDKTARIWSADNFKPVGTIRPPLGPNDDGALYAIDATTSILAIGGRIRDGDRQFQVQFYRWPDLKMIGHLGRLPAPVSALKFSRDGHTLVVGMVGGAGVGFYDMRTGTPDPPDGTTYAGEVQSIDVDMAGRTVISAEDGHVRLYGADHRKTADMVLAGAKPLGVAFSPDGKFIAVGSQSSARVDLLDTALHLVRSFAGAPGHTGAFGVVAFAPDGRGLYGAGTYKSGANGARAARLWSVDGKGASEFDLGSDTVTNLVPIGSDIVMTDGLPNIARLNAAGHVLATQNSRSVDFRDAGLAGFGVSYDGTAIMLPASADHRIAFDTRARAVVGAADAPFLTRPSDHGGSLLATGWRNGSSVELNKQPLRLEADERSLAVAVSTAANGAAFGTNFYLRFMRADGGNWATIVPAPAYAVNISGDGHWVVAGLGDGTVRWYDAASGHEVLDLFFAPVTRHWVLSTPDGFFDHDIGEGGQPDGRDLIGYSLNDAQGQSARYIEIGQLYPRFYRPDIVGLALQRDTASRQLVQAAEQRQVSVSSLLGRGLPPSVELLDICGKLAAVKATGCSATRPLDTPNPADHAGTKLTTTADTVVVRYRVSDPARKPGSVQISRNQAVIAPVPFTAVDDADSRTDEVAIPLGDGDNAIRIRPISAAGDVQGSDAASITFNVWRSPPPVDPGIASAGKKAAPVRHITLYLLSVGINAYDHSELTLDNASSDAQAVTRVMGTADPPLYDAVHPVELLDKQATVENVSNALQFISDNAQPDDLVMIFLAGHGQEVDGHYYFAPVSLGTADPALFQQALQQGGPKIDDLFRREGMGPERLLPLIQSIKAAHVAIILDTCFSGSLATEDTVMRHNVNTTVTNALGHAVGRFVLSSAITFALDSAEAAGQTAQDGHGLFTAFLLAALQGQADLLHTGKIDVVQLANYTIQHVVQSTAGQAQKQQPTFYFSGSDFFALRTD